MAIQILVIQTAAARAYTLEEDRDVVYLNGDLAGHINNNLDFWIGFDIKHRYKIVFFYFFTIRERIESYHSMRNNWSNGKEDVQGVTANP
jgi:hypothetical protein